MMMKPMSRESISLGEPSSSNGVEDGADHEEEMVVTEHHVFDPNSSSDSPQVYLSVMWSGNRLGAAYYDVNTTEIYMLPDVLENDNFQILKTVILQVQPSCVIASSKLDERLLKVLQQEGGTEREGTGLHDESDLWAHIKLLPSFEFSLDLCRRRILSLKLPGIPEHFSDTERSLHFSSLLSLDSTNMVRALGGLLKYLEKNRVGIELEGPGTAVPVLSLEVMNIDDLMMMDENTYSALQIFKKEGHPSVYKAGSSKEGLSLYGILNRCRSQIGSKTLRQWFQQPLKSIDKIQKRQEAVAFFASPRNLEVTTALSNALATMKSVPRILARMRQARASVGEWQALYKTAVSAVLIADKIAAQQVPIDIFDKFKQVPQEDLHRISQLIDKIVDFKESAVQNRFVVKQHVDPALDEKKRTYTGLPDFMAKVAQEELKQLSDSFKECSVIYLPQLGYLLAIPMCDAIQEENDYYIPHLQFQFMANNMVHYKSQSTRKLDSMLGDIHCDIIDQETSIMHHLQDTILKYSPALLKVMQYAAELDCLISLGVCAHDGNYCCPLLTSDSIIKIEGGRHPLQELCCCPFVPNDFISGGDDSKIKVLTGPNASGKSVYLKQVALIVFMTQIGSFVPAQSALIGPVDGIFSRICTLESVSVGLSAFMIDLNQVAGAVHNATHRSLVVLDEFGKGTETVDGTALLCGVLRYWLRQTDRCPHVLVSTHFSSLVSNRLLPSSPLLLFQTFEVLEDGPELVFLYHVKDGMANTSHACYIAAQSGLRKEIIKRGLEVTELLQQNKEIHRLDKPKRQTLLRWSKMIVTRFMDLDLEQADVEGFLKECVTSAKQENIEK